MHVPQVGAMRKLLSDLYQSDCSGDSSDLSSQLLHSSLQQSGNSDNPDEALLWNGSDSVLITYADTVTESDR